MEFNIYHVGCRMVRETFAHQLGVKNLGLHRATNQITVELNSIPAGMYLVSLYAGNKHIESRQLSVTH